MRFEILGHFVNTLTANYEYSCSNRENLPLPIQIKFSKTSYTLVLFFLHFWNLHEISNVLVKKMSYIGQVFLKLLPPNGVLI